MKEINSITLEIISNGITSIAEQMGVILAKTGDSTNIKERKDLSVAVFSPEGKLLSLAQHIPLAPCPYLQDFLRVYRSLHTSYVPIW